MNKTMVIAAIIIVLCVSAGLAKDLTWSGIEIPSEKLSKTELADLELKKITQWKSEAYWRDGNCYYYDLSIGDEDMGLLKSKLVASYDDEGNIRYDVVEEVVQPTWQDPRREFYCGEPLLPEQLQALQLKDITWTLQQLSKEEQSEQIVKIYSQKGEDFKKNVILE